MAFAIYLNHQQFQPEDPQILDQHVTPETKFTFVDFVPSVIKRSTNSSLKTAEIEYHSFSDMIATANDWLQKNLEWEVINCETVMLLYKFNDSGSYYELRPNDTTFYIYGSEKNNVLKALRLWVKRREELTEKTECPEYQILQKLDMIPENDEGEYSGSKFQSLDEVVKKANDMIKEGRLEGRIITIETLQCDATIDWKIDPEVSLSSFSSKSMFILRIFFEKGPAPEEEIGIADFVPQHLSGGGFFKKPKFESYNEVMGRASHWLSENPELSFKNAQSIDVKLKSLTTMDTKIMSYTEHGDYLRIFRVAYTKPLAPETEDSSGPPPSVSVYLASKLFMPSKKTDSIADIKRKLEEWVNEVTQEYVKIQAELDASDLHKPRLLSAETVEVFCKSEGEELDKIVDDTFQFNRFGNKNGFILMIFRVYFDVGFYGWNRITAGRGENAPEGDDEGGEGSEGKMGSNVNNTCIIM